MRGKSKGTTPSERYLARLCEGTFLRLWSYPNIYRDQGKDASGGDGKEVCDLLVVCGNDVIIFSDKSCEFKSSGNLNTEWSRWYRKAIKKSTDQLIGAQRWLRNYPDRVFLDRTCDTRFPLDLSHIGDCRFHLVVVALGAKKRCQQELGGSGSIVICPELIGQQHVASNCKPFYVGQVDPKKGFVHVFDDVTLDVILRELDTIADFVDYLRRKEEFILAGKLALAAGEENLLAYYVTHMSPKGGHDIVLPDGYQQLVVEDGHWNDYVHSPAYQRKWRANEKSYIWDHLIEEFTTHTVNGTAIATSTRSVADAEVGFRIMARESRLSRRVLSHAWADRLETASGEMISIRTVLSNDSPETAYVFLAVPEKLNDENKYREFRRGYLDRYCFVLAWKQKLRRVVGIASEPGLRNPNRSHDFMVFEPDKWSEEMVRDAQTVQKELDILRDEKLQIKPYHDDEYPPERKPSRNPKSSNRGQMTPRVTSRRSVRVGRNEPCPCGSGQKFKKCCMRNG